MKCPWEEGKGLEALTRVLWPLLIVMMQLTKLIDFNGRGDFREKEIKGKRETEEGKRKLSTAARHENRQ